VEDIACLCNQCYPSRLLQSSSNRDLDLNTSLNIDNDLLDNLGGSIEINQTLMDPHLESIPSLGSLTTGRLPGGDLQGLGWEADRAFDSEVLGLGTLDELLADFLEGGDFSAGQGDADFVGFRALAEIFLFVVGHLDRWIILHDSNERMNVCYG